MIESAAEEHSEHLRESLSAEEHAQQMAEARATLSAIEALIAKVGGGGITESQAVINSVNRGGGAAARMVAHSLQSALTTWGLPASSNAWIHSGTAGYFYGVRHAHQSTEGGPMSDVDCHVHPLGAKHREIAGGHGLIHVDAYDPCVDLGQQWAQDIEAGVAGASIFCTVPAFVKTATGAEQPAPIKIITLNQLYHEYNTIIRMKDGKQYHKPADEDTKKGAVKLGATTGARDYLTKL